MRIDALHRPHYHIFKNLMADLHLTLSVSELHGIMTAYLCLGLAKQGLNYLSAMFSSHLHNNKEAISAIFGLYALTEYQIARQQFEFQLFLPPDEDHLTDRAEAFSQWCQGLMHGFSMTHIQTASFEDEDVQDALQHIHAFSELDYESLELNEDDEQAFIQIQEYTRVTILHIYADQHQAHPSEPNDLVVAH